MARNEGIGSLSYRGLAALGIGVVFLWFSLSPEGFGDAKPPLVVRAIVLLTGAGLAYGGLVSVRFVWKRWSLVRTRTPVAAEICVLQDDDPDRATETVHVRVHGRCQALGVDRSGIARRHADATVRLGEVWLDDDGAIHALALAGKHLLPLIGGQAIPAERFGSSEA